MNKFFIVMVLLALGGCSTVVQHISITQEVSKSNVKTTSIIIKDPVSEVATVGDYMITNGYSVSDTTSFSVRSFYSKVSMLHDINVVAPHKLRKFVFYMPKSSLSYAGESQVGSAYAYAGEFIDGKNRKVTGGLILNDKRIPTHIYWSWDKIKTFSAPLNEQAEVINDYVDERDIPKSFHRTIYNSSTKALIYSGLQNGKISFTYYEFTRGGILKPVFTQHVTLDYDPGQEYAFKEARFKVLRAGVADIEYKLIQGFDIFVGK